MEDTKDFSDLDYLYSIDFNGDEEYNDEIYQIYKSQGKKYFYCQPIWNDETFGPFDDEHAMYTHIIKLLIDKSKKDFKRMDLAQKILIRYEGLIDPILKYAEEQGV